MIRHEKIDYVEFPAVNLEATKAFFSRAFGWAFQDYGPDYISFSDSGIAGGFYRAELCTRCEKGGALVVLYSNDLEASYDKVLNAGGVILKEIFSFPGGKRFHFTEPSGNEFALWSEK